jgi:hypothetical protein
MSLLFLCIILNVSLVGYLLFGVVLFPPKTKVNKYYRISLLILIVLLLIFYSLYWTMPNSFRF